MAGYVGYSMSNNAVWSYSNGEMPLSKWNTTNFYKWLEVLFQDNNINDLRKNEILNLLSQLKFNEIKKKYIIYASYHHTSKYYNVTNFYKIDDIILEISKDDVDSIIASRKSEKKIYNKPLYVTAYIEYAEWTGRGRYMRKTYDRAYVQYMSDAKKVYGKLLSKIKILDSIVQKTKFAPIEALKKRIERGN